MSAPSERSTTPATGSPASSSRTPSSAGPIFVCDAGERQILHRRRRVPASTRTGRAGRRNRSESDFISGLPGSPNCCRGELGSRLPAPVRNLHAPGIVDEHRHDVLLRHGGADDQRRPEEAEEDQRQRGHAKQREDEPDRAAARR